MIRIHKILIAVVAICIASFLPLPLAAVEPTVASPAYVGDAAAGKQKSKAELCQECHGADGNGMSREFMSTPKLAGQPTAYIVKQLRDFQSGARMHAVMSVMARDLNESDRLDIAAYFSSQQRSKEFDASYSQPGRDLFMYGDADRNIPQCINCHAVDGKGAQRELIYPALGGQRRTYLHIQLVRWRMGERHNSAGGVMNQIGQALSDDDIDALSAYLSGL